MEGTQVNGMENYPHVGENGGVNDGVTISFTPHYHTLTMSGKSHFLRPADAMAEIVDNSIQACKNNKELGRVIKVFLYLKKNGGSFLAVMDNGCGMNIDKIRDFATYSLDQETRNQFAEKGDKSFISKFGVGVKQAGFFLGDRVRVLTKTIDTEEVSEFSLDRESFEEKTRNKQNPYSSTIKFRRKGVSDLLYPDERSEMELVNKIMEHEEANNQFTTILIRLHADMSKKLRKKLSHIPLQLADIYHFQLHPENRPEHMVGESNGRSRRTEIFSPSEITFLPPLDIRFLVTEKNTFDPMSLSELDANPISKFVNQKKAGFVFKMLIPDPDPSISLPATQLTQATQMGGEPIRCRVDGMIFYYPFEEGSSTRPSDSYDEQQTLSNTLPVEGENEVVISIFWQDRLVPETTVSRLSFFPDYKNRFQCIRNEIAENWKARIKGFLFFDWSFNHISNNKLKIQVDPNLEDWLNQKVNIQQTILKPAKCADQFLSWLKKSHKELDQIYNFFDKIPISEALNACRLDLYRVPQSQGRPSTKGIPLNERLVKTFFKEMRYGNERVSKGMVVKFPLKVAGTVYTVYANVIDFAIEESLPDQESSYNGIGYIRYYRLPFSDLGIEPVSSLDMTERTKFRVKQTELDQVMAKVPHFIEVVIFERKGDDGVVIGTNNIAEMFVCKQYYKIGIQLVNKDGQPIAYRPDFPRSNASKYKVAISLPDLNIDYGTTNTLYRYDPGTNTDVVNETHTSLQDSYYAAYSVTIKRVGITPLKVVVFDGTDEILERIVHFEVTTAIPSGYRVEWGEEYEKKLAFGDFLPTFKIQFVDNDNEDLPFYGVAIVSISSDLVDIVCTKENGAYLVDIKNSGSINCKKGDWICKPLNQRATKAGSKSGIDASLTLKLSIVDDTQRVIQIGNETHTHLCCTAGLPYSLELVMPMITPISCKADDHLPSITLSVLDEWGCLATTGPYEWRAILSCDLLDLAVNSFELQNGNIVIPPIPLKIPEHMTISSVGLSSVCSLELACNTLNGEKIYQPRIDIPINVFASVYPHTLHVLVENERLQEHSSIPCGTTLSSVAFEVVDQNGLVMPFDRSWFTSKTSWIDCSWSRQQKVGRKRRVTDAFLPDIQLPEKLGPQSYAIDLSVSIYDYQLSTSCTIALVPGSPVAWQFLTSGEIYKGIRRGSPDDLRSKVRCVFLVDRYGNMIPRDSDQPTPLLQLQWNHITVIGGEETVPNGVDAEVEAEECDEMEEVVESTQQTKDGSRKRGRRGNEIVKSKKKQKLSVDSTSILLEPSVIRLSDSDYSSESSRLGGHVDHTPMSMDEEFLHDFACWTISPTASLADIPKEVEFVRLNVSDLESAFRPSSEAHWIALKAGLPHFLYISIPSLHVPEPCPSVTVEVAADTKIHYVQAHLYDLSGKPSSAEDITHIEIELVAPNDQKFTLKRTNNHSVYSLHMLNMAQTQRDSSNSFTPLSQIVGSPSNASQGISYLPKDPYTIEYTCKGSYQLQSSAIVHLEPAILTCHIIQLNAVVELSLCTISCATDSQPDECQINEIPLEDDERVLTMTCDHFLPEFWLTNKTANGTPFVLPVESLKCTIKPFKCAKSKKVIEFSKLYNMVSLEAEENSAESEVENEPGIRFYLLDDNKTVGSCFSPGKYAFTITYTEERAELKELLNPKKLQQTHTVILSIEPGKAVCLSPSAASTRLLTDLVVSSTTSGTSNAPEVNVIGENITLLLQDRFDNYTTLQDHELCCFLRLQKDMEDDQSSQLSQSTSAEYTQKKLDFVHLLDSDKNGLVMAENVEGKYIFPVLALANNDHESDSNVKYDLVFTICKYHEERWRFKRSLQHVAVVKYTSKRQTFARVNIIKQHLNPLREKQQKFRDLQSAVQEGNLSVERLVEENRLESMLRRNFEEGYNVQSLERYADKLIDQLKDMETVSRKSVKPTNCPKPFILGYGTNMIGLTIDLAFVDDSKEAQIVSWAASQFMDVVIVRDSATATEVYKKNMKVLALDQIIPFKFKDYDGEIRRRNAEELASGKLPLPEFTHVKRGRTILFEKGHPRYLVNLIEIQEQMEYLRDTIFYSFFGKSILFDDMESATEYRSSLVERGISPPIIYTMAGERILNSGILDPSKRGRLPSRLDYVFGQQSSTDSKEFKSLHAAVQGLRDVIELKQSVESLEGELELLETEMPDVDRLIEEYENELNELGVPSLSTTNTQYTQKNSLRLSNR